MRHSRQNRKRNCDGINHTVLENHSHNNNNNSQLRWQDEEEEERTRRRIEERHMGKRTESSLSSGRNSTTTDGHCINRQDEDDEMAKSDRILNSLIEEVRHRNESLVPLKANKERMEANDEEGTEKRHKKHKKKKREKEDERKSTKKSSRSSKHRNENGEEKHTERNNKRRRHYSEDKEGSEDVRIKHNEEERIEPDGAKKIGKVINGQQGMPFRSAFGFFTHKNERDDHSAKIKVLFRPSANPLEKRQIEINDSESEEEMAGPSSDEQSDGLFQRMKPPSLGNILASAPPAFPWLTALGKPKQSETEAELKTDKSGEKAEGSQRNAELKTEEHAAKKAGQKTERTDNETDSERHKASKRKIRRHKHSSKRSSPKKKRSKKPNRSRSQTYSTSPERVHYHERGRRHRSRNDKPSTSKSPSPLPPFSRQRAFETRRKLIEESWHRRIEHSIRPCDVPQKKGDSAVDNGLDESNYTDENGRIDKQKLLEIATRNATRLAMEGKLPKGAELIGTIKNKSVQQLVDLCKNLQSDRLLVLKRHGDGSSSGDSDGERQYSHKYEQWRQEKQRREDKEFRNRAVRPAGESAPLSRREQKEVVHREENTLRLTFPVSSGVQHRTKTNVPTSNELLHVGPLVRFGDIGPLTTALSKVKTNLPSAYKPLSKPLPNSQPNSTSLSSNFQSTSQVPIGPQQPSPHCQPNKPSLYPGFLPSKTLDCVNQNVYEIALAASVRKEEAESRDKAAQNVPTTATSSEFIGPIVPNPAVGTVLAASHMLRTESAALESKFSPTVLSVAATAPSKSVFSSSWDRPGHIAAREALLKKMADEKRKAEESAKAKMASDALRTQSQQNQSQNVPLIADSVHFQPPSETPSLLASTVPQSVHNNGSIIANSASMFQQRQPDANEANTNADKLFKKPALPVVKQSFVASVSGTPVASQTPARTESVNVSVTTASDGKIGQPAQAMDGEGKPFLDRFHTFVETQVARQKAESALQATILTTHLHQKQPGSNMELATFSGSSSTSRYDSVMSTLIPSRPDPIGLTKTPRSIQELVTERLRYTQRLQRDPNDYEARKAMARVEKEMNSWAQESSSLTGEFTGHTGARVLSEKELEPSDPRFHAWAKKDQFRTAPEINSGIGMKLLQRMGWQPGQGLGRLRAGQLEPLTLDVKADRKGLSSCFERAPTRESVLDPTGKNPISVLMEQCARHRWRNPEFSCVESGPQNNKRYHWKAVLNGVEYAPSLPSSNKRAGKAQVCMVILEALNLASN